MEGLREINALSGDTIPDPIRGITVPFLFIGGSQPDPKLQSKIAEKRFKRMYLEE